MNMISQSGSSPSPSAVRHEKAVQRLIKHEQRPAQPEVNVGEEERRLSIAGGAALIGLGFMKRGMGGLLLGGLGVALLRRGFSGHCALYETLDIHRAGFPSAGVSDNEGVKIEQSIMIQRSPAEVFAFLRDFSHLPRFIPDLESVETLDEKHFRWTLRTAFGRYLVGDLEIITERGNEFIGWESLPGADIQSAGSIHLKAAPENGGTELKISAKFNLAGGPLAHRVWKFFGQAPGQQIQEALRRLKQLLEAGEISVSSNGAAH